MRTSEISISQPVLELKDVWKIYKMDSVEVTALKEMSLKINKGEFVAVMGASGSGKSTALSIMGALDVPTKGEVFLDGVEITKLSESKIARLRGKSIGFVFQMFNLYPTLNVYENIALPMRIHEFGKERIEAKVKELLKLIGMENRKSHLPSQLSGGEKQRVAVARALSTEPSMVLADEPTGNLDSKISAEIMQLLVELNKKEKKTIVIVTHEQEIADYTDRTIMLRDGKIVFDGKSRKRGS